MPPIGGSGRQVVRFQNQEDDGTLVQHKVVANHRRSDERRADRAAARRWRGFARSRAMSMGPVEQS